jgi:large subunit ribosomal protein L15
MMIHEITQKVAKYRPRKRVGRGESSGMGKTAGRGHKGARSRSGWSLPPQYQGGQINFIQKMPKRGFSNAPFKKVFHIVNVKALEAIGQNGDEVTAATLAAAGLIRDDKLPLKILGEGDLTKKLTVTANKFSASAKSKIEAAGGRVNELVRPKWERERPAKPARAPRPADSAGGAPAAAAAVTAPEKSESKSSKKEKPAQEPKKKEG